MGNADVRKLTRNYLPILERHGFAAVLWDWDGVLVDSGYNFYQAYEMLLRDELERVLTEAQARWFDVIITADDALRGKPDPEPFLLATRALKMEPEKCIVIENAPFGIEAARNAGCAVPAICTTLSKEYLVRANWIVKDHEELEVLLLGDTRQDADEEISSVSGDSR